MYKSNTNMYREKSRKYAPILRYNLVQGVDIIVRGVIGVKVRQLMLGHAYHVRHRVLVMLLTA